MKSSMKMIFFLLMLPVCFRMQGNAPAEKEPSVRVTITQPEDVKFKKGKKIPELVITANYRSCVILAEIARRKKGVPYILLPAVGEEKGKIHFIPAKKEDIFSISPKDLGKFIAFLAPGKIIVLGDELMVPRTFRPLSTGETPCINISSPNWKFNSLTFGNFLMIEDMQMLYEKACNENITDPLKNGLKKTEKKEEKTVPQK